MTDYRSSGWARIVWSAVGQALSSITNFGLGAALVASGSTADLGRAMSVVSVYYVALTVGRALFAESLVAALDSCDRHWAWVRRRLLMIGLLAGPTAASVGLFVGMELASVLVIAFAQPMLMVQDGYRYLAWNHSRPSGAAALDAVWVVVSTLAALAALLAGMHVTTTLIAVIWAGGGIASALVAPPLTTCRLPGPQIGSRRDQSRAGSQPGSPMTEDLVGERETHRELAHSQSMLTASFNLVPVALALLVSTEMAGLAKAVVLPFGPWLAMAGGLRMVTLPSVTAWRLGQAPSKGRSPALGHAALLLPISLLAALLSAGVTLTVADRLDPLRDAAPYLGFGMAFCVLFTVGQVLADGVALGPTRHRTVSLRVVTVGIEWCGLLLGALLGGPLTMLGGWVGAMAVGVSLWWLAALRSGGAVPERSRLEACSPVHQPALFPMPPVPTSSRTPMAG